jgi:hypothetical protein
MCSATSRAPGCWELPALAIFAMATAPLTLIIGIAASSVVLVAVALADTIRENDHPPSSLA